MKQDHFRNRPARRTALAGALAVGAILCLPAPARAAGHGEYGPLEIKGSEQQLMKSTAGYEDQFVRRSYRYGSADLDAAITRIGLLLAPKPTDPYIRYRFHVLRDIEPNAFSLPDGQVYVNTGLLAVLENEAQLAAVLGHEVQHTAGHHGILTYRSTRRKLITGSLLGPFTLGISDIFLINSLYGYSRDLEEEADRLGAQKMTRAGYDPRQIPKVFAILMRDPEGESPDFKTFWSTHPALQSRIDYTRAMIPGLTVGVNPDGLKVNAQGFRRLVRRASLDTVQDLVGADYGRTAIDLAKRLVAENGGDPACQIALGDARVALGARAMLGAEGDLTNRDKWKNLKTRVRYTRSERQEQLLETPEGQKNLRKNLEEARQSYQRALAIDPNAAEAHRGLGYVYKGMNRPFDAGREFVTYLKASPQAPDKPVILSELKEINTKIKKGGKGT
ncbi:MAG TPA: M48 family metalloprotease [Candidatus Polarisedimenticolia bacterium]|nr:M48 family metalloprotease [Candidatus Polarisedimenticolia bacterium]